MTRLEQMLQRHAELVRANRDLANAQDDDGNVRALTGEERGTFETRMTEITTLATDIASLRQLEAAAAELDAGEGREAIIDPAGEGTDEPTTPFRNFGEFVRCVRFGPETEEERAFSMTTGAEGGILIPDQFLSDIQALKPEEAIVRPRAMVIPAGDPPDAKISLPALKQGADGVYGGVEVVWIAEGAEKPETDAKLEEIILDPQEVAAHSTLSDKLIRNAPAASPFVSNLLRGAIINSEDYAFLRGDGVGKPKGILLADALLTVTRNTASDVKFADISTMLSYLLPDSWGSALWVANVSTLPKLVQLADAAGNSIFIAGDASKGIPATLLGIPIRFTGKTPTLGNEGDLMLTDFSYYLIKDGSGPFVSASEHVYFKNNKTVIKAFWNVDGQAWPSEALTLEDGSTEVSPFVALK